MRKPRIKNVFWRGDIAYFRASVQGAERVESLRTADPSTARRLAREHLDALRTEVQSGGKKAVARTFADGLSCFKDNHYPELDEKTKTRYSGSLGKIGPFVSAAPSLDEISHGDIARFVAARRADGIAAATIKRDIETLSNMLETCIDYDLCTRNAARMWLRRQKKKSGSHSIKESAPRVRFVTPLEEYQIVEACLRSDRRTPYVRWLVACFVPLCIGLGCREEELRLSTWDAVDWDRQEFVVSKAIAKRGKGRRIPLLPRALEILRGMYAQRRGTYIFQSETLDQPVGSLLHALQDFATEGGVAHVTQHDLRRTCGVRLLRGEAGASRALSMQEVSSWLGHSSIKVTERHYAFLSVDNLHRAAGTHQLSIEVPTLNLAFVRRAVQIPGPELVSAA